MPSPHSSSHHSSSSHSSSSRSSSSHSSSSHSSSSRSSSSSSRSYSSHSSSSHSSYSRSTPGRSTPSRSPAPSQRSTYVKNGSMQGKVIQRPRQNQPAGFERYTTPYRQPSRHYCVRHNYVYYPVSWVDETTGQSYKKGYYDEKGTHYDKVIFKQNGRYDSVPCVCDYCGARSTRSLKEDTTLLCTQCGAPLRIDAVLDEYTQDPAYTRSGAPGSARPRSSHRGLLITLGLVLGFFLFLIIVGSISSARNSVPVYAEPMEEPEIVSLDEPGALGTTLYLDRVGDGAYILSPDDDASYDKKLTWDYSEESYYDRDSDCWIWCDPDESPFYWQYWYEGISSDYESGWMEYDPEGWFIETDYDDWIPLPDTYVSDRLWHVENEAPAPANTEIFGTTLYLDLVGDNTYVLSPDGAESYDMLLTWDDEREGYWDPESDCRIWYNTDVYPNLWQYWFEGISSDYESGWMEYEPEGWFIETDYGTWIPLPDTYDAGSLWHLEIDPADFS